MMTRLVVSSFALALVSSVTACGGRQEPESAPVVEEEPMAMLSLIHAAGALRATAMLGAIELGALASGESSDMAPVPAGSRTLAINAVDGETELASERVTLAADTEYVGIVGGTTESLFLVLLDDGIPTPAEGTAFVRFVNGLNSPVTVTAGERELAGGLASGTFTTYTQMAPESYRFEAAAGDATGGVSVSVNAGGTYLVIPFMNGTEIGFVVKTLR